MSFAVVNWCMDVQGSGQRGIIHPVIQQKQHVQHVTNFGYDEC